MSTPAGGRTGTPAPNGVPDGGSTPQAAPPPPAPTAQQQAPRGPPNSDDSYRMILEYLDRHGHSRTVQTLRAELSGVAPPQTPAPPADGGGGRSTPLDQFADRNAPLAPKQPAPASGTATPQQQQRRGGGAALMTDPASWDKGYSGLRAFVENSLDIHRPELEPLLLPLFVHSYLDLILIGQRDAADTFLKIYSTDYLITSPHIPRLLASIRNESHVREAEQVQRWRQERYHLRLSERGWGLLLGWLQGGGLAGSTEGTEGRGRDRVLAIINERVKIDTAPGPPNAQPTNFGLASEVVSSVQTKPEDLKLGPAPIDPKLEREVQRTLQDKDKDSPASAPSATAVGVDGEGDVPMASTSTSTTTPASTAKEQEKEKPKSALPPLTAPFLNEMLPYPTTLRTIDVAREVEKVREARKRIKLGPSTAGNEVALLGAKPGLANRGNEGAKPSVCLFTVHDAGESLTTTAFSEDSTLMAAGFSESYIRLWNLKGGKLASLRQDFDSDSITDAATLSKLRQPLSTAPTTRKLIGHSGPIYSLSFDPVPGPSSPPRYLLSASQDSTIRLWSLETYTALVAFRGHREPVWCVEWGPKGIYFASGGRDRTARLWTTDRKEAVRIFAGHGSDVNCVKFHPNSLYLATGSADRTCRLWDVQKGTCVRVFVGHRGSVTALAMSPDGRWLASAADDSQIIIWDLSTSKRVKTLSGHQGPVYSLSFSIESTVLVSAGADGTVRAWDVLAAHPGGFALGGGAAGGAGSGGAGGEMGVPGTGGVKKLNGAVGNGPAGVMKGRRGEEGIAKPGMMGSSEDGRESADLLCTLATKKTPVLHVQFTPRNLVLAAGPMVDD